MDEYWIDDNSLYFVSDLIKPHLNFNLFTKPAIIYRDNNWRDCISCDNQWCNIKAFCKHGNYTIHCLQWPKWNNPIHNISNIHKGFYNEDLFFVCSGMFGAMSIYGYTTSKDLTSWRSFLFMGLIGVIIASVVNMFFHSTQMEFVISVIGILVFIGLTAYDTQKLKQMGQNAPLDKKNLPYKKGPSLGHLPCILIL